MDKQILAIGSALPVDTSVQGGEPEERLRNAEDRASELRCHTMGKRVGGEEGQGATVCYSGS
jgi:hypothetical protein